MTSPKSIYLTSTSFTQCFIYVLQFCMASPKPIYPTSLLSLTKACMCFIFLWFFKDLSTIILPSEFPLQPVLSICDSCTKQLSSYVTHFLQPLAGALPVYIHYSNHFIQLLETLPASPGNIFPHLFSLYFFTGYAHRIL